MRGIALLTLLALTACVEAERKDTGLSDVPRDSRGDPVLPAPDAVPGAVPLKVESCAHRRRCP